MRKKYVIIIPFFVICLFLFKWDVVEASDVVITGGSNKGNAVQIMQYGKNYATEIKREKENLWFYISTNNYDAYYNFYVKDLSLSPQSIGGHAQGVHVHVYSVLNEEITSLKAVFGEGEENSSVKLEKNSKYFINIHSGSNSSCESKSTGYVRLRIDCTKDFVSDEKNESTAIAMDQTITNTLDGTGDDDWYSFKTNYAGQYKIFLKSYGLNPSSIEGHRYDVHLHLYSRLGEGLGNLYSFGAEISEDIYLERNTTYYIVLHSGIGSWSYCDGNGTSIPTGSYSFSIFPKSSLSKYCSHDYKKTVLSPTYVNKGYTLYQCVNCGNSYKSNYISEKRLSKGRIRSCEVLKNKRKIKINFKAISEVSGYQIMYSTNKKMNKNKKIVSVSKNKLSKQINKVKKKKRYYIKVRGYKVENGKTVYGNWSNRKSVKIK